MNRKLKFISFILCILLSILCFSVQPVYATTDKYTDVLIDLHTDSTFNTGDYPTISDLNHIDCSCGTSQDFQSIQVIQVAESIDKELFIYTYQPASSVISLEAVAISLWTEFSENGKDFTPIVFELELLSSSSVFYKYIVKDFKVCDESHRYYNISQIYRKLNDNIDENVSGSVSGQKALNVGQQWLSYWFNDEIIYEMNTFETMDIIVDYVGFINIGKEPLFIGNRDNHFGMQIGLYGTRTHQHFISFSCEEYKIKHIYDAYLTWYQRDNAVFDELTGDMYGTGVNDDGTLNSDYPWYSKDTTLRDVDQVSFTSTSLLYKREYTWNRILKSSDYIKGFEDQGITFSDECKSSLNNSEWVFAFTETKLENTNDSNFSVDVGSEVALVSILRIHFMDINNKIYNLSCVADRVTADGILDGRSETNLQKWFDKIMQLIGILALLICISFCLPVITAVFNILVPIIKFVFSCIFNVILLPFKLIGKLFKKKNKS